MWPFELVAQRAEHFELPVNLGKAYRNHLERNLGLRPFRPRSIEGMDEASLGHEPGDPG